MVSHIPYRAWCSHCVRGRGKSFAHRRVNRQEDPEEVPVVSIDYGFFGAPGELPADAVGGAQMPVLVVRDRKSKALFSHLVPSKERSGTLLPRARSGERHQVSGLPECGHQE